MYRFVNAYVDAVYAYSWIRIENKNSAVGQNVGSCDAPFRGGAGFPSNTVCPTSAPSAGIFGHNKQRLQTGRTDNGPKHTQGGPAKVRPTYIFDGNI